MDQAPPVKPPSPIDEQLLYIDQSIGALYQAIGTLHDRLSRVLTPQPTSDGESKNEIVAASGSSSIVYTLNEMNQRTIALERMVHEITGRVEL